MAEAPGSCLLGETPRSRSFQIHRFSPGTCVPSSYSKSQIQTVQVRAGEGQSEADGRVFTNPVYKTSMYSGLTPGARRQVVTQLVPNLRALGACQEVPCCALPAVLF